MPSASLSLARAILEALAYSDIFDYPLRFDELHRYLPAHANADELSAVLDSLRGQVEQQDGFYYLTGRDEIVNIRQQREARSRKLLPIALRYGRILGSLPFIRMVALTGSLAVLNVTKHADFDYMLVAAKGRVWTARAFALLFNRFTRLFGHTLCPNLIVSESALEWPLHDLYSARELIQMIPIAGMDVYRDVMEVNSWVAEFVPQSSLCDSRAKTATNPRGALRGVATTIKRFFEFPLRGKLGDHFESWEMTRKIARFSNQPGFGEETIFTAEVCQGNFHHHRKWARDVFQDKMDALTRQYETSKERIREFV
ncbi:MAG TPA: hypothetical protein PKK96_12230 [Anaerolineales bacterium]|nr:hypothetical protein [Anaerolineales bacterium]HNQ95051.1 hypothetical protein [Anaerolineales bacterium]HNS61767.1 hypothetical protein [Anaerolineales bacterium]